MTSTASTSTHADLCARTHDADTPCHTAPATHAGITSWAAAGPGGPHAVIDAHPATYLDPDALASLISHLQHLRRHLTH